MTLEDFIAILCLVGAVVCYAVYRYTSENVKLTYKDQRVGGKK